MKINDVLECFNKVIDTTDNPNKVHYVAHSSWERKIGTVKSAYTIISICSLNEKPREIIKSEYTTTMPNGQEEVLIEETQRRALTEFIKQWSNDTGIK